MRRKLLSCLTPRPSRVVVVAVIASLVFSAVAIAAAGDLDPTFSADGRQRTNFGAGPSAAAAAVRQADGKIVAVGAADDNFLVARYNLDGSLDPSFSGDGRVQTDFMGFDGAADVALQGNKIVVVGAGGDPGNDGSGDGFALARLNLNGTLDTNFSGDGKQLTNIDYLFDQANAVAVQANGKLVVVGRSGTDRFASCCSGFALARYNPNGSLDTGFSGDGLQRTFFGANGDEAKGVAVQADGKIVAAGIDYDGDFALARYNMNGSLDASFSGDGRQTTDFGGLEGASGVALQTNNRIVAAGRAIPTSSEPGDFTLARYNSNGSLDPSFSGDGRQTTDFGFGADDGANDVAIQASGRIVAVGLAGGGITGDDFGLARYNVNGALDTSFSADGRKRTNFGGTDSANGVALQGDGRLVVVGVGNEEFALARHLGN
jgi:uncharacterized delta-60 repeat protein